MVLKAVSADLEKNGLELEAVSVTTLNQTDLKFFKDDNVIDAEGKTLITRETEARRRERNDISQETEVAIAHRNLEASQRKFSIRQAEEQARLEQEEKVANLTAEQNARVLTPGDVDGMVTFTMDSNTEVAIARATGIGDLKFFSKIHHGGGG